MLLEHGMGHAVSNPCTSYALRHCDHAQQLASEPVLHACDPVVPIGPGRAAPCKLTTPASPHQQQRPHRPCRLLMLMAVLLRD